MSVLLELGGDLHDRLVRHLLRPGSDFEEAAFLFAQATRAGDDLRLVVKDNVLLAPDAFTFRSPRYLELSDETRQMLIKRAHDLGACLVEVHSHPRFTAQFSWSDKRGLREFVPHIWWRLKGKPYVAIVVAPTGFDAVAWISGPQAPQLLDGLLVDGLVKRPTGLSLPCWNEEDEYVGPSF